MNRILILLLIAFFIFIAGCHQVQPQPVVQYNPNATEHPPGGDWYKVGDLVPPIVQGRKCYLIKARFPTGNPMDRIPDGTDRLGESGLAIEVADSPLSVFSGPLGMYDPGSTHLWIGIINTIPGEPVLPTWMRKYSDNKATSWVMVPWPDSYPLLNWPWRVVCHEIDKDNNRVKLSFWY